MRKVRATVTFSLRFQGDRARGFRTGAVPKLDLATQTATSPGGVSVGVLLNFDKSHQRSLFGSNLSPAYEVSFQSSRLLTDTRLLAKIASNGLYPGPTLIGVPEAYWWIPA